MTLPSIYKARTLSEFKQNLSLHAQNISVSVGVLGGRKFFIERESGSIPLKTIVKRLEALYEKSSKDADAARLVQESLKVIRRWDSRGAAQVNILTTSSIQKTLTKIRSWFGSLFFDWRVAVQKLTDATRPVQPPSAFSASVRNAGLPQDPEEVRYQDFMREGQERYDANRKIEQTPVLETLKTLEIPDSFFELKGADDEASSGQAVVSPGSQQETFLRHIGSLFSKDRSKIEEAFDAVKEDPIQFRKLVSLLARSSYAPVAETCRFLEGRIWPETTTWSSEALKQELLPRFVAEMLELRKATTYSSLLGWVNTSVDLTDEWSRIRSQGFASAEFTIDPVKIFGEGDFFASTAELSPVLVRGIAINLRKCSAKTLLEQQQRIQKGERILAVGLKVSISQSAACHFPMRLINPLFSELKNLPGLVSFSIDTDNRQTLRAKERASLASFSDSEREPLLEIFRANPHFVSFKGDISGMSSEGRDTFNREKEEILKGRDPQKTLVASFKGNS